MDAYSHTSATELMKLGGKYLTQLRLQRGITQGELTNLLFIRNHEKIGQYETGKDGPPRRRLDLMADIFRMDRELFAKIIMMYYDPNKYKEQFGEPTRAELEDFKTKVQVAVFPGNVSSTERISLEGRIDDEHD